MPIEDLISRKITGIDPHDSLPINATIWREAHDHHHDHRRLHAAAAHRPGIVYGLEVIPRSGSKTSIVVAPGVGIDPEGRTIVLSDPVAFDLKEKGTIYITVSYEDTFDSKSAIKVGGGTKYFRLVEGRKVVATKELPKTAYIELARIQRTAEGAEIKEASNPFDPAEDEINTLYRPVAFPHCYASGGVGEMSLIPKENPKSWKPNRAGLWNLIREGNGRGFHLEFTGVYNLRAAGTGRDPVLLYTSVAEAFQSPSAEQLEGLKKYLGNGGVLLAEAAKGSDGFAKAFQDLAKSVGATLKPLGKGHPVLSAHYMFPAAPPGGQDKGEFLGDEKAGVFLSTFDYGGAWQGEVAKPDASDARERVRQAQEFGLNLVAYAAKRQRFVELARL